MDAPANLAGPSLVAFERALAEWRLDHAALMALQILESIDAAYGEFGHIDVGATTEELGEFRKKLMADPGNFISQPMVKLSVSPTLCDVGVKARHIDLRPFAVTGRDTWVLPGGLTRVALRPGSLVV